MQNQILRREIKLIFTKKMWAWYPEKQPNLKISGKIKKKRPMAPIAAKLESAGNKIF